MSVKKKYRMPTVKVRNNNVEAALRVFKKKCSEVVWECREREFYTTPSEKRRKAQKAAEIRDRKRGKK